MNHPIFKYFCLISLLTFSMRAVSLVVERRKKNHFLVSEKALFLFLSPILTIRNALQKHRFSFADLKVLATQFFLNFAIAGAVMMVAARVLAVSQGSILESWVTSIEFYFSLQAAWVILTLHWRLIGYETLPIAVEPFRSKTPQEFWSTRWNVPFHLWFEKYLFLPASRKFGVAIGLFATFFVSGLMHELLIVVPGRGQVGSVTAYFLIQGLSILTFRKIWKSKTNWMTQFVTLAVVIGPIRLLFTEAFYKVFPFHRLFF